MQSIQELYILYEKYIFRYLYGLTGNYQVAEELTQETFFQVIKSFNRFTGKSSVTTWLYGVARNVYHTWYRKNPKSLVDIEEATLTASLKDTPHYKLEEKEKTFMITKALKILPDNYREIIILRDWQGLSYEEISKITGKSLSWVKVNIHRARNAFKQEYNQLMEGFKDE